MNVAAEKSFRDAQRQSVARRAAAKKRVGQHIPRFFRVSAAPEQPLVSQWRTNLGQSAGKSVQTLSLWLEGVSHAQPDLAMPQLGQMTRTLIEIVPRVINDLIETLALWYWPTANVSSKATTIPPSS
jgi:hypothetical protein